MPKSDISLIDSLLMPQRSSTRRQKMPDESRFDPMIEGRDLWANAASGLPPAEAELDQTSAPSKGRMISARAQALVSLTPAERSARDEAAVVDTTFTDDDPRACPRDLEEFRLALAVDLDRLRAVKKKY